MFIILTGYTENNMNISLVVYFFLHAVKNLL